MALRMLARWDVQAKNLTEDRELRLALLASGRLTPAQAFPDRFEDAEKSETTLGDEDYDYSGVAWESPGEDGSNYDTVMAALNAHRTFTTREGSESTEEVTEAIPLGPDDTEWI
jgi:hypothetical protein